MFSLLSRFSLVFYIAYILIIALGIFYKIYTAYRDTTGVTAFDKAVFVIGFATVVFLFAALIGAVIYVKNR